MARLSFPLFVYLSVSGSSWATHRDPKPSDGATFRTDPKSDALLWFMPSNAVLKVLSTSKGEFLLKEAIYITSAIKSFFWRELDRFFSNLLRDNKGKAKIDRRLQLLTKKLCFLETRID